MMIAFEHMTHVSISPSLLFVMLQSVLPSVAVCYSLLQSVVQSVTECYRRILLPFFHFSLACLDLSKDPCILSKEYRAFLVENKDFLTPTCD